MRPPLLVERDQPRCLGRRAAIGERPVEGVAVLPNPFDVEHVGRIRRAGSARLIRNAGGGVSIGATLASTGRVAPKARGGVSVCRGPRSPPPDRLRRSTSPVKGEVNQASAVSLRAAAASASARR